jgi:hypothetical protein
MRPYSIEAQPHRSLKLDAGDPLRGDRCQWRGE